MAWVLRQFFEGDKVITVANVAGEGVCWIGGENTYEPNTIAIKVDGVETILPTVKNISNGFLTINMPSGKFVGPTTTIQVYAKCVDTADTKTLTLTAKPVKFQVYNGPILACSNQITLTSDFDEYVRLFITDIASPNYFNLKINGVNAALTDFSYQSGDTGNIAVSNGNFSRPANDTAADSLISTNTYAGVNGVVSITITPNSTQYFTARLGYLEVVFTGTVLRYNNYLLNADFDIEMGTYVPGDVIQISATNSDYTVKKNGAVLITKTKTISYTVSGGSVVPSNSQVGLAVAWNLPTNVGGVYDLIATVGDALAFKKTITVHSCANANDDSFTGVSNTPFSGDVTTNDALCTGENSYIVLAAVSSLVGGAVTLNQNGTFVFTPTQGFNGVGGFQYQLRCGADFATAENIDAAFVKINYFDPCSGVVANWVANGQTRCTNCTEERQEIDANTSCTGNQPRWVANPGGGACNRQADLVETGQKRCSNCIEQKEVQDLNTCSPTYQNKSWVANDLGTLCNKTANWIPTGTLSCINCVEKREERDVTLCSPTYNQTRVADNLGGTACSSQPIWTNLNEFTCIECVEYQKQQDTNSCSPTYQQKRNILNPNGNVCNKTPAWIDSGVTRCQSGVHQKLQRSTNKCSQLQEQWVNSGLDLCGCTAQVSISAICNPRDFETNPIVGVHVHITGADEQNRLVSFANNVVTFRADDGVHNYVIELTRQTGIGISIYLNNHKCNN